MRRNFTLCIGLILLFAAVAAESGFSRGAPERSPEREHSVTLPESVSDDMDPEWEAEFVERLVQASGEAMVPQTVLEMALSRLPSDAVELPAQTAADLVQREATVLDRELRRGALANRATVDAARRLAVSVAEEIAVRRVAGESAPGEGTGPSGEAGPPSDAGPERAGGEPGRAAWPGAPDGIGGNRAEERIRERTAPVRPPGGPPDPENLFERYGPPGDTDGTYDGAPSDDDDTPASPDDDPVDYPTGPT